MSDIGIDLETITRHLLDEGVAAFAKPFESLMNSLKAKRERLSGSSIEKTTGDKRKETT